MVFYRKIPLLINTRAVKGNVKREELMPISGAFAIFIDIFSITYTWLIHNFVNPLIAFAKEFEVGIMITASIIFVLITVFFVLRQAKKLSKSYKIQIINVLGHENVNSEFKQSFQTYEAAESYAREYRKLYEENFKFKVVGIG
jgi:hypothetical protein